MLLHLTWPGSFLHPTSHHIPMACTSQCFTLPPQAKRVAERLAEKKIKLELTDSAVDFLARAGYDPVYGARCVGVPCQAVTSIGCAVLVFVPLARTVLASAHDMETGCLHV